jgi:hypothetical protein
MEEAGWRVGTARHPTKHMLNHGDEPSFRVDLRYSAFSASIAGEWRGTVRLAQADKQA